MNRRKFKVESNSIQTSLVPFRKQTAHIIAAEKRFVSVCKGLCRNSNGFDKEIVIHLTYLSPQIKYAISIIPEESGRPPGLTTATLWTGPFSSSYTYSASAACIIHVRPGRCPKLAPSTRNPTLVNGHWQPFARKNANIAYISMEKNSST